MLHCLTFHCNGPTQTVNFWNMQNYEMWIQRLPASAASISKPTVCLRRLVP